MKTIKITSKTTLAKILELPGAENILFKHHVPCLSCPIASLELEKLQIGQVSKIYGLDLAPIIEELNSLLKENIK